MSAAKRLTPVADAATTRLDLRLVQKIAGDFGGALGTVLARPSHERSPLETQRVARVSGSVGCRATPLGGRDLDFGEVDEPWGLAWLQLRFKMARRQR